MSTPDIFHNGYGWTPPEEPSHGRWTEGEDAVIQFMLPRDYRYVEIAEAIGRTREAVSQHICYRQIRPEPIDVTPRADTRGGVA